MDYNLKIYLSGDNKIEIYYYNNYVIRGTKLKNQNISKQLTPEEISEVNKKHCRNYYLSTVRNTIIRLAECNSDIFKSFITLTYKEDVSEDDNARYLNLLFTKLRKVYPNLSYIWVLERTKKGRIHVHLLTSISFKSCISSSKKRKTDAHKSVEVAFETTYWTYKGAVLGWVDIRSINTDITKYSLYIAKYLTKDNNVVAKDKHIYGYSRNLKRPRKIAYLTKCTLEEILEHLKDYNISYSTNYNIEYGYDYTAIVTYLNCYKKSYI